MTQKRKRELILIAVLCLAALLLLLWQRLGSSKRGKRVIVSQYGTVVGDYPLSKDREDVFQTSDGGVNTLIIHNGEAWISEANCPDKVCVHTGRISRTGEIIACLPHRLVVQISEQLKQACEEKEAPCPLSDRALSRSQNSAKLPGLYGNSESLSFSGFQLAKRVLPSPVSTESAV